MENPAPANIQSFMNKLFPIFTALFTSLILTASQISAPRAEQLVSNTVFQKVKASESETQYSTFGIAKDEIGYLWFATDNGLYRYDGYDYKIFRNDENKPHSLTRNETIALLYSRRKELWVGTVNGLNLYQPQTESFRHYFPFPRDDSDLRTNRIFKMIEDVNNNLWIMTGDYQIALFETKARIFKDTQQLNGKIKNLLAGKKNTTGRVLASVNDKVWASIGESILQIDINTLSVDTLNNILTRKTQNQTIFSLSASIDNVVWAGSINTVYRYDLLNDTLQTYSLTQNAEQSGRVIPIALLADNSESTWVATTSGLFSIDARLGETVYFRHDPSNVDSLSADFLWSLYRDDERALWLGTHASIVNRLSENAIQFKNFLSPKTGDCVWKKGFRKIIQENSGTIWAGSLDGLYRITEKEGSKFCRVYTHSNKAEKQSDIAINELLLDSSDRLWVGSLSFGLMIYKKDEDQFHRVWQSSHSQSSIKSITEDWRGHIWALTEKIIVELDTTGAVVKEYQLKDLGSSDSDHFVDLEVQNKTLWVSLGTNLLEIDIETGDSQRHKHIGQPPLYLQELYVDTSNALWLMTDGGIYRMQKSQHPNFERINTQAQLENATEDTEGNLWIATYSGLLRINTKSLETDLFTHHDGLASIRIDHVYFDPTSREVLFAHADGFSSVKPKSLVKQLKPPQVVLTDFLLFNKPVSVSTPNSPTVLPQSISILDTLDIHHEHDIFSIAFSSSSHNEVDEIRYRYRLLGLNERWIEASSKSRIATYTQLSPGTYKFEANSTNSKGQWSPEVTQLAIKVHPPLWWTWWAKTFYFIASILGLFALYRSRINRIERQNKVLEENVKLRTLELKEETEKTRALLDERNKEFAYLSHEFRTPLTLIQGPASQIISNDACDAKSQAKLIQQNAYRLLHMVNQLLHFEKLKTKSITDRIPYKIDTKLEEIISTFRPFAEKKCISITHRDITQETVLLGRDAFEKIILNLLSNAIKYTPDKGTIDLAITHLKDVLTIRVSNSGKGIPEAFHESVFDRFTRLPNSQRIEGSGIGLALVKEIVLAHNGTIHLSNIKAQNDAGVESVVGCEFTITLPAPSTQAGATTSPAMESKLDDHLIEQFVNLDEPTIAENFQSKNDELDRNDSRKTILVVEDNPQLQQHIVEILSPTYCILTADSGKAGLELAQSEMPDIIISDVMMPEMDGFELTNRIKSEEQTCHIPIILLTAKIDLESQLKGLTFEADHYLTKPFSVEVLTLTVRNLLLALARQSASIQKELTAGLSLTSACEKANTPKPNTEFFQKVEKCIENGYQDPNLTIGMIADQLHVSTRALQRKMKALTNIPPNEYLRQYRLNRAKQLIESNADTISNIAFDVGFSSMSYFSSCFKSSFGVSPGDYRMQVDDSA